MAIIEFWEGVTLDVNLSQLAASSVPVKGKIYHDPCRFIEIYGNTSPLRRVSKSLLCDSMCSYSDQEIKNTFLPRIPQVRVELGYGIHQPPFVWSDCLPNALAVNFTYNTNAIFRILSNLSEAGIIPQRHINSLMDESCLLLSSIYKSNNTMVKHINNNINMFIISKVIEVLLGKRVYDSERQEISHTGRALLLALEMVEDHASLGPKEQMALALGKGIAFVEKYSFFNTLPREVSLSISEMTYKYTETQIAIDDRQTLLDIVDDAMERGNDILMCAILDDTVESIDDLLWMQSLMVQFPNFKVNLLLNIAQISINFSAYMFDTVIKSKYFIDLRIRLGKQLLITNTYCPLISFQHNLLMPEAKEAIHSADIVYVKGMNFFETCQLVEKPVFHSFVVYGPISRLYSGLNDFDGVFAFLPAGVPGYRHSTDQTRIKTLREIRCSLDSNCTEICNRN